MKLRRSADAESLETRAAPMEGGWKHYYCNTTILLRESHAGREERIGATTASFRCCRCCRSGVQQQQQSQATMESSRELRGLCRVVPPSRLLLEAAVAARAVRRRCHARSPLRAVLVPRWLHCRYYAPLRGQLCGSCARAPLRARPWYRSQGADVPDGRTNAM